MKKYFSHLFTMVFFSLLLISVAQAYDGVVIVLEAPLLKSPDLSSQVLQNLRKGERVFVPREAFDGDTVPEFIPTFDRAGNRAYIPSRYIKVITHTEAEKKLPLTILGHDPTDYRLPEPLPESYPFEDNNFMRTSVSFLLGNNTKAPYAYGTSFNQQNFQNEMGARLTIMKKVSFDNYDRFYFGFVGIVSTSRNSLSFQNQNSADESRSVLRLGPLLTFDAFKNERYRLTLGTGFTYNYHRSSITINASNDESEQRLFSGYSLSPLASTTFQVSNLLPDTDFISGVDLNFYLPSTQTTKDTPEFPELWPQSNQIKSGFKAQVALFLGIQVKY